MSDTAEEVLSGFVTEGYLRKLFKRGGLTINLWRRDKALPFVRIPGDGRDAIRYRLDEVKQWAKENDKRVYAVLEVSDD